MEFSSAPNSQGVNEILEIHKRIQRISEMRGAMDKAEKCLVVAREAVQIKRFKAADENLELANIYLKEAVE